MHVADHAVTGDLEDGGVGIFVDSHDDLGGFHARKMLHRARQTAADVKLGADRLARLTDLVIVSYPTGINGSSRRTESAAKRIG